MRVSLVRETTDDTDGGVPRVDLALNSVVELGRKSVGGSGRVSRHQARVCATVRGGAALVTLEVLDGARPVYVSQGGAVAQVDGGGKRVLQVGDALALLPEDALRYRVVVEKAAETPAVERSTSASGSTKREASATLPAPRPFKREREDNAWEPSPYTWYNTVVAVPGADNSRALDLRPLFAEKGIQRVLITSYELEAEFLLSSFPILLSVETFVACPAVPSSHPPNWKCHVPALPLQYGTAHGKLFLIYFADRLRVILTSANAIRADHLYKMNGLWTQTFPLVESSRQGTPAPSNASWRIDYTRDANDFGPVLQDYLSRLGVPAHFYQLRQFDFSKAAVALVSSVPGIFKGASMDHYGYNRVRHVLNVENALRGGNKLTFQCSSLGTLSDNYISSFTQALCGGPGSKLELIWPTAEFVRTCVAGWSAGGAIPLNEKAYNAALQKIMVHKLAGAKDRVAIPPHLKTMFRQESPQSPRVSWFYMGSHNLSKSSWGESQLDGAQFRVPSFEIGVIFLPRLLGQNVDLRLGFVGDARDAPGIMPIPYQFPPSGQYDHSRNSSGNRNSNLDNVPWMWDHDFGANLDVHHQSWHGISRH